ncbi:hypothetical protein ACFX13_033554 [Malus domestica]
MLGPALEPLAQISSHYAARLILCPSLPTTSLLLAGLAPKSQSAFQLQGFGLLHSNWTKSDCLSPWCWASCLRLLAQKLAHAGLLLTPFPTASKLLGSS